VSIRVASTLRERRHRSHLRLKRPAAVPPRARFFLRLCGSRSQIAPPPASQA
jgi:hypothetical protein